MCRFWIDWFMLWMQIETRILQSVRGMAMARVNDETMLGCRSIWYPYSHS